MFMDLHGHSILKNSFIYGPSEIDFKNEICKILYLFSKKTALLLMAQIEILQNVLMQVPHIKIKNINCQNVFSNQRECVIFYLLKLFRSVRIKLTNFSVD